jgi:protein-tyrosine phosphatase
MFSFLKSKPRLSNLIPSNFVDIHSHILPGIDDGAKSLSHSEFLLESMIHLGFSKVITTPHIMSGVWNNTSSTIDNAANEVKNNLPNLANQVGLHYASEYFLDENLMQIAQQEKLLTLKDNFILVEMSYLNPPIQLYDYLFELQLKGYQLVLAHPERYSFYHENKKEYTKLKKAGCLFQLNLLSTVGYYGKGTAKLTDYLLKENLYDFVGSDIHNKNHIASFQNKIVLKNQSKLEEIISKNEFFR